MTTDSLILYGNCSQYTRAGATHAVLCRFVVHSNLSPERLDVLALCSSKDNYSGVVKNILLRRLLCLTLAFSSRYADEYVGVELGIAGSSLQKHRSQSPLPRKKQYSIPHDVVGSWCARGVCHSLAEASALAADLC